MEYAGWPILAQQCPCCGRASCAVYRGYYTRFLFCPEMEFVGRLVIRTGYCKRKRRRFALLPDFVIRYRRVSALSLGRFHECYRGANGRILPAIDEWIGDLGDEFHIARSTAHSYLSVKIAAPP